jgi:glucose-6-phosphate 1-dehydrogenase
MTASRSDARVLFGATGDLAHKMIFPVRPSISAVVLLCLERAVSIFGTPYACQLDTRGAL